MAHSDPLPPLAWHCEPAETVLARVGGSAGGLTGDDAADRLRIHGANVLSEATRRTPLALFAAQFADFMILVLVAAAIVSGAIGEIVDAAAIVAIVILNAVIGFVQEFRAERAMAALRAMAAPSATVLRDGAPVVVPAAELVPGDVVRLDAGRIVPADLRLLESVHLRIDEAALTGESVPAEKMTSPLGGDDLPVGDRANMAWKSTTVTYGRGSGVVVATGMATEFGRIAAALRDTEEVRTPLQRRLARFGEKLSYAVLGICAVVFLSGLARGEPPLEIFLVAVSLAVAAIPEALPAVVTISLALGARRMVAKHALVRRLPAVETLGSVTYVCSDKTGTLTMNRMRVEALFADGELRRSPGDGGSWPDLVLAMALSNDAESGAGGEIAGDPTEVALLAAARAAGADKTELEPRFPRVAEIPFDSERKRMTTVHRDPAGGFVAFTKGAVESVLAAVAGEDAARIEAIGERMAADGLRVLAIAERRLESLPTPADPAALESGLRFLGLVGLIDPPREEARRAVAQCRTAGIVPVMITGDHAVTARAIASRLGILDDDGAVLTGRELAALSDEAFAERVTRIRVYARVAPEQKLRIVTALQERGELVAMTGDGVNDAPALKRADIGVAMGVTGTDVAKEASAMILLDDDFATIVRAVREGRRIYDNVRRFIRYVVTTNSAEIWTIFLAPFLGLPIPLLPIQILWINLVTDGLPGLTLAAEPEEPDLMRRPPRPPGESVLANGLGLHALWVGLLMAGLTLGTQAWMLGTSPEHAQTATFTVLCFTQLAHALAIRSERHSIVTQGLFSNRPLLGAVVLTAGLQLTVIYLPALRAIFETVPLGAGALALALGAGAVVIAAVETEKWLRRREPAVRRS